jgi:hypothetical protein
MHRRTFDWIHSNSERTAHIRQSIRSWIPLRGNLVLALVVLVLTWGGYLGALASPAAAPATVSTGVMAYQGRLTFPDGTPVTATKPMIFRIYDLAIGGTLLWEEQWTGIYSIQVTNGMFDVMLGSRTPIDPEIANRSTLFIGVSVDSDPEMSPRLQLGSTPFAMQALTIPDGSVSRAKIANGAIDGTKIDLGAVAGGHIANGTITGFDLAGSGFGANNRPIYNFVMFPKTNLPISHVNSGSVGWTMVDLSGSVPPGTAAVLLYGFAGDTNGSTAFSEIRFNGFATADPNDGVYAVVPQGPQSGVYQGIVPLDASRRMYYKITASGANTFNTGWKMIGYWEPANR